jgi:hypothetical protein
MMRSIIFRPFALWLGSLIVFQPAVLAQAAPAFSDPSAFSDTQPVYDGSSDEQAASAVDQANLIAQMIVLQTDPQQSEPGLTDQLQSNPVWVAAFNTLFSATVPFEGPVIGEDVLKIAGLEGDPKFNAAAFLKALVPTRDLYVSIKSQSARIGAFNALFNAGITASGPLSGEDLKKIFSITGDPDHRLRDFLSALPKAHSLLSAMKAHPDRRSDFNLIFGATLKASGPLTAADLKKLFSVAGDPDFHQPRFFKALDPAAALFRAFRANAARRADFNLLYGTRLSGAGAPSGPDIAALFSVAATPGFNLNQYLPVLEKASDLLRALRASPARRASFDRKQKTSIGASGALSGQELSKIFAIAGTPGYKQGDFLASL